MPGATAQMCSRRAVSWGATLRTKPITACLVSVYTGSLAIGTSPASEAVTAMTPPGAITSAIRRVPRTTPSRLVATTRRYEERGSATRSRSPPVIPALRQASSTGATRSQAAGSATSKPPARSSTSTAVPPARSRATSAAPMPDEPPVTSAEAGNTGRLQYAAVHSSTPGGAAPAGPVEEPDIVETRVQASALRRPPLLVLEAVRSFLDEHGLGSGELRAARVGRGGGSNFSFLVERESGERYVLRRPPRPPLPPSAHDVVREARLQLAL